MGPYSAMGKNNNLKKQVISGSKSKKKKITDAPVTPESKKLIDMTDDTKRDAKYDYSAIFNVKEEFIFVFGGKSTKSWADSVEVFDI